MDESYFVGFRVLRPKGSWVLMGPYHTYEEAKRERERAKAPNVEVTVPFVAKDKIAAEQHSFLGR